MELELAVTTEEAWSRVEGWTWWNLQKQDYFPWEKVPFVPRPSLVPDPFTVWGRKRQDPKKEFYQYATIKDKEGTVRGKNPAKEEHTRQLVDGGAVSKVSLDAAAELATKGHVFEKGVLSRPAITKRHAVTPPSGRTKILMALQTPSWYRFWESVSRTKENFLNSTLRGDILIPCFVGFS